VYVGEDWQPAWSSDGITIAYQHESFREPHGVAGIYIIRVYADSVSRPERVSRPKSMVYGLRFSPDGRRLAYYWGNIFILDLDTKETTQVTYGGQVGVPDWHPDGQHIVYNGAARDHFPADSGSIRVVDLATRVDHSLHMADGKVLNGEDPRWDPTGQSLVFRSYDRTTGGSEIWRAWPSLSRVVRLTGRGWNCQFPRWFRDGTEVVFLINYWDVPPPNKADWWVVGADGIGLRPFLNDHERVRLGASLDFSPDGEQVVVCRVSNCATYMALWIIRFNETEILEERQITGLPGQAP
jgi:Tol biopolymer transport system component